MQEHGMKITKPFSREQLECLGIYMKEYLRSRWKHLRFERMSAKLLFDGKVPYINAKTKIEHPRYRIYVIAIPLAACNGLKMRQPPTNPNANLYMISC